MEQVALNMNEGTEIFRESKDVVPDFGRSLEDRPGEDLTTPFNMEKEKPVFGASEKEALTQRTGWSESLCQEISSPEEAGIYENANLKEAIIGEKNYLIRTDVDFNQKDDFGRSNLDLMKEGKPPYTRSGESVEIHHIGQKSDGAFAELTKGEHRSPGNFKVLHDSTRESEINRHEFKKERETYWKMRAEQIEAQMGGTS
jgi:hypothetical protein